MLPPPVMVAKRGVRSVLCSDPLLLSSSLGVPKCMPAVGIVEAKMAKKPSLGVAVNEGKSNVRAKQWLEPI